MKTARKQLSVFVALAFFSKQGESAKRRHAVVLHADKNTQEAQFVKISDFLSSEKLEKRIVSVNKCYQRLYKYTYFYVKMRKIICHRDLENK